jgi:hypothetical protein
MHTRGNTCKFREITERYLSHQGANIYIGLQFFPPKFLLAHWFRGQKKYQDNPPRPRSPSPHPDLLCLGLPVHATTSAAAPQLRRCPPTSSRAPAVRRRLSLGRISPAGIASPPPPAASPLTASPPPPASSPIRRQLPLPSVASLLSNRSRNSPGRQDLERLPWSCPQDLEHN